MCQETAKILYCFVFAIVCILGITSCEKSNVETAFFEDAPGKDFYVQNISPLLESKCFNCHNYHNTSTSRYDTYLKASGAINQIVNRVTSSNPNAVMPPLGGGETLTNDEIDMLLMFKELIESDGVSSESVIDLQWTAYKFPGFDDRVGVSGSFDEIFYSFKNLDANNIYSFLVDAEITINTSSVNVGNDTEKNNNLRYNFFNVFSPVIHCKAIEFDELTREANVEITMNGITEQILFLIQDDGENIKFTSTLKNIIDDWGAGYGLDLLNIVCGDYHQGVVWPDIDLSLEIKNYRKLYEQ